VSVVIYSLINNPFLLYSFSVASRKSSGKGSPSSGPGGVPGSGPGSGGLNNSVTVPDDSTEVGGETQGKNGKN
jgi:hypothetical protein